jgi:hypothetical protein
MCRWNSAALMLRNSLELMLCPEDAEDDAASSISRAPERRSRKGVIRRIIALLIGWSDRSL